MPRNNTRSKALGKRIRHVREKIARLNQIDFAARLGVTPPAVAQWELGTAGCSVDHLEAIVGEFRVRRDWLYAGEGPSPMPGTSYAAPTILQYLALYRRYTIARRNGSYRDRFAEAGLDNGRE